MARCDSYYYGECTYGACIDAGWIPDGLGNGGDWAANAGRFGLQVTDIPTVGAAVCYAAGDGYSSFGHCGIVRAVGVNGQFLVHEMNFVAFAQYDDRWSNTFDVAGFVLPPGVSPGSSPAQGRGGPGPVADMYTTWSTFVGDWSFTVPEHINRLRTARALLDTFY